MALARVAITGIGVVSAFGAGREAFWDGIQRGQSGTRAITEFDASSYRLPRCGAGPASRHRRRDGARRRTGAA